MRNVLTFIFSLSFSRMVIVFNFTYLILMICVFIVKEKIERCPDTWKKFLFLFPSLQSWEIEVLYPNTHDLPRMNVDIRSTVFEGS